MKSVGYEVRKNTGVSDSGNSFEWFQLRLVYDVDHDILIKITRDQANQIKLLEDIARLQQSK